MLRLRDLCTEIIKPVSFELAAGECIAVRGPSGAGKTLLLRAIADLDPNEGTVTLGDIVRAAIPAPAWRRLIGYVPAEPGWWAETAGEHFDQWDIAATYLTRLGLGDVHDWPIARMSTGERLRLALARALVASPKVLLLDEPTAALDTDSVAAVEALVAAQMQMGLAVLWVTHDAAQAKRIARRYLTVDAGQVREEMRA